MKNIRKFSNLAILNGIKVLDLSRILAGPFCSMYLSDFGCDVIKIESFKGDETRYWGPPYNQSVKILNKLSTYFLSINRNKKSICIDLKS
jgi:crotonobetainyl-CoA:carnitine CoA-transferase CaiB-like acyl-CoA transferase